jgi:hypothetical protein
MLPAFFGKRAENTPLIRRRCQWQLKVKSLSCTSRKQRGSGGIPPVTLNLDTRWE